MRTDNRLPDQMRPVEISAGYLLTAEGSALITVGNTRVLCAASVEDSVPAFLRGSGKGWVTAEWKQSEHNRRARFYRLTNEGRKQMSHEVSEFERVVAAIGRVIEPA